MDKSFLNEFYANLRIHASICLAPGLSCSENPIKAHSIQNSKVFDQLNFDGHLIGLKIKISKTHKPDISFDKIGRNKASTFEGFCSRHDKELFEEIDDHQFDKNNVKQLFLLAYRSVCKELHASMSKAIKIQRAYLSKVDKGLIDGNSVSPEGLFATQSLADAYETFLYKSELDDSLITGNYDKLFHHIFEIELDSPKLTCSQLFSNDSVLYKDSVSRIIMNIFPVSKHQTLAIFSSVEGEKHYVEDYLYKCIQSSGYLRNYEISKMIIRNSENFYISPLHFETWSIEKKNKILTYFLETLYEDKDKDDLAYYLF